jgi:hypothetical protein
MPASIHYQRASLFAIAALALAAAGTPLAAQPAGGKAQNPAGATKPAAGSATEPDTARPGEAERRRVVESPEWRAMQHGLKEWLSIQQVYTPSQLRKVKANLNAKVSRMSADQLIEFMADMNAKLRILMGKQAEQFRLWAEQKLSTQVNLTDEQLKEMRPDVLEMTSAQLQEKLDEWQQQRQMTLANQKAFSQNRATEIKNIEAMEKDEEHERDEALNRSYYEMSNGSPYGGYYGGRGGYGGGTLNNPPWFRGGGGFYPGYRY